MNNFKKNISWQTLSIVILVSLVSGILGGGLVSAYYFKINYLKPGTNNEAPIIKTVEKQVYIEESDLITARDKVAPSVVSIIAKKEVANLTINPDNFFFFDPFFDPFFDFPNSRRAPVQPKKDQTEKSEKRVIGGGTGFIITADGLILTNKHVVADQEAEYVILMNDGSEYLAEVKSRDPLNDVAIVQMKPKDPKDKKQLGSLPVVELGDSDKLKIGQRVLAIGNALAEYQNTTTAGIISATGRNITAADGQGKAENLTGLIQTDAAINPGNSGGPLIDLQGQVIGINTAIDREANGIGFAIPINDVKPILDSFKQYGRIVRPILGVRYIILTEEKAKELQIDVKYGALLIGDPEIGKFAVIPGGAADKAGLKMADVILEVEGKKIDVNYTLQDAIQNRKPGDKLKLKVWRSDKEMKIEVELGESKEE